MGSWNEELSWCGSPAMGLAWDYRAQMMEPETQHASLEFSVTPSYYPHCNLAEMAESGISVSAEDSATVSQPEVA